jgi:hypothetical protein
MPALPGVKSVGLEKRPSRLERLVFFSDAVFAIAIILLVLPLTEAHLDDEHLTSELLALWPELLSFALSFLVVGTYWIAHHRMFNHIVRLDARMLWINLGFRRASRSCRSRPRYWQAWGHHHRGGVVRGGDVGDRVRLRRVMAVRLPAAPTDRTGSGSAVGAALDPAGAGGTDRVPAVQPTDPTK